MHCLLLETIHVSDGTKIRRLLQQFTSVEWFFCFLITMFLLCNFLIRLTVVFFYYNVEWHAWGGGVCTCSWWGKREYPTESSNLFRTNSHPVQLWVSQWSFFFFWPYMDSIFIFCFILQFKFFPVFLDMKMYDHEYDTKETKIIQG